MKTIPAVDPPFFVTCLPIESSCFVTKAGKNFTSVPSETETVGLLRLQRQSGRLAFKSMSSVLVIQGLRQSISGFEIFQLKKFLTNSTKPELASSSKYN